MQNIRCWYFFFWTSIIRTLVFELNNIVNLRYGASTLSEPQPLKRYFFSSFFKFVKDKLSFFHFLSVLLLPDINLFKYNFAQTPRALWSGNSNLFTLFHNIETFKFKICKLATTEAFFNCWTEQNWRTKTSKLPATSLFTLKYFFE